MLASFYKKILFLFLITSFAISIQITNYPIPWLMDSGGFSTISALGEISTAPPNCNSNPYEKKANGIMK